MSEPREAPLLRHAPARVHGRYFVSPPGPGADLWLVGFHGQGQTADLFMQSLDRVPRGPRWLVATVQGLYRYYIRGGRVVAANWMTTQDRELVIRDNVAWVDTVLDCLEAEFGAPRAIVFAGFSQGVAMAYRAGRLCRRGCAAIVAGCGDLPPELKSAEGPPWPCVLAATGTRDDWYTPARLEDDLTFLRTVRPDVRSLAFEGGHEWGDALTAATGRLMEEVEAGASV